MNMNKVAVVATLIAVALGATAGTANAGPSSAEGAVGYRATTNSKSTIVETDAGSMDVENGRHIGGRSIFHHHQCAIHSGQVVSAVTGPSSA